MYIQQHPIVLASKSPRRQELLKLMGLDFIVTLKEVDESYPENLAPSAIAMHISNKKATAFGDSKDKIVITADTIVALGSEILGKPADRNDAERMLNLLSGTKHEVYTGVTLLNNNKSYTFFDKSEVICREVTSKEIAYYIEKFKPFDKAGSYGIQDWWGLTVVKSIEGSYTNVMGLPTEKLYQELKRF